MNSAQLKRAKRGVRVEVLARRDAIPDAARARGGDAIAEAFFDLPEVENARNVAAFWSFGSEVPTLPLLERLHRAGLSVALPRIVDGELEPRRWAPGDETSETAFGAREPLLDAASVEPSDLDVVVVPGVAFDRAGRRVGYGGGYYDRFLLRAPQAARIAIAFATQVVQGDLPAGRSDLGVDAIVTEGGTIRVDRGDG